MAGLFVAALPATAAPMLPLASVDHACERLGQRLRSVDSAFCRAAEFEADAASQAGFPLLYRDYPPRPETANPRRVLMIGGIHGDELTSVSIVFDWMRRLEEERLQPFRWRVIPSANPDGLLRSPSWRMNRGGVDLNRNFPSLDWHNRALSYWRQRIGG